MTTRTSTKIRTNTKTFEFGVVSRGDEVVVCLPVPPSANRYWRNYRGMTVVSEEAKTYKAEVGWLCSSLDPFPGNVAVSVTVYRARKTGDLDNYMKVLLDALKGILYADDDKVTEIHAFREDDKENPRVVVTAWDAKRS